MITKILRYCKGVVRIRIVSHSPERFLNLCRNYYIEIWRLVYQDGYYECEMLLEDFRRIRPIVHKSHTRLRITRRYGLPFFLYQNRKRKITYISCFLFFAILYVMSLFIWDIQFEGNQKYTSDVLMKFVNSQGYVQGMKVDSVVCEGLEKALRNEYEDINWVSAMIDGTRLVVKIKENSGILHVEEKTDQPGNLVADKEGTVYSVITRKGTPAVKPGDEIVPGDLLISGNVDVLNDEGEIMAAHQVAADADVIVEREYAYEDKTLSAHLVKKYTKNKTHYFLQLLDYRFQIFPVSLKEQTELITAKHQFKLFSNFYLPVYYGTCEEKKYEEWTETYGEEEMITISEAKLQRYLKNLEKLGVEIIQNSVKIGWDADGCISSGIVKVREKIGMLQPFGDQQQIEETTRANEHN